jgi:hypothetical protein
LESSGIAQRNREQAVIHTIWAEDDDPELTMLIQGEHLNEKHKQLCPPMHLVHTFDATSPNDAKRRYHEWLGREPYMPTLDAEGKDLYPEDELPFNESATQN